MNIVAPAGPSPALVPPLGPTAPAHRRARLPELLATWVYYAILGLGAGVPPIAGLCRLLLA